MKLTYDKDKFTLYSYPSDKKMLVAVDSENVPKIEHAIKEFGSFKEVPSEWEVWGIFFEPIKGKGITFDPDALQSEIVINCLADYKPSA